MGSFKSNLDKPVGCHQTAFGWVTNGTARQKKLSCRHWSESATYLQACSALQVTQKNYHHSSPKGVSNVGVVAVW